LIIILLHYYYPFDTVLSIEKV